MTNTRPNPQARIEELNRWLANAERRLRSPYTNGRAKAQCRSDIHRYRVEISELRGRLAGESNDG